MGIVKTYVSLVSLFVGMNLMVYCVSGCLILYVAVVFVELYANTVPLAVELVDEKAVKELPFLVAVTELKVGAKL
jgi:hypothetical protein